MAYELIWSPASRDDLRDIVHFISRDSRRRAEMFGYRLIAETDKLQHFSELGRIVPEYGLPTIREIIVRSYRSFTASITSGSWSRLHEYGMQREARRNCDYVREIRTPPPII
jgi:plasmid stabilization system protein ParE